MYIILWKLTQGTCWGMMLWVSHQLLRRFNERLCDNMKRKKESSWGMSSPGLCFTNTSDMLPQIFKGMSHSQALSWPFIKYFCALVLPFLQCSLREDRGHGLPLKILARQVWCWEKNVPWGFWMCDTSALLADFPKSLTLSVTNSSIGDKNSPTMGLCLTTFIPDFLL